MWLIQVIPHARPRYSTKSVDLADAFRCRDRYVGSMSERTLQNFIGGEYVSSSSDSSFSVIDPATEGTYASSPVSNAADVDRAYQAASTAFEGWRDSTPAERQLALFRIADAMEARAEEFADAESQDTGKPRATLVDDEIMLSVDQIRFFARADSNLESKAAA